MNALAHIVRDIVSGREPSQVDLRRLDSQELSALKELQMAATRAPRELAGMLAAAGPQENWLSPQELATKLAVAGPQENWLSPQELATKLAVAGPQENWLSPQELARKLAVAGPQENWLSPEKASKPVVA